MEDLVKRILRNKLNVFEVKCIGQDKRIFYTEMILQGIKDAFIRDAGEIKSISEEGGVSLEQATGIWLGNKYSEITEQVAKEVGVTAGTIKDKPARTTGLSVLDFRALAIEALLAGNYQELKDKLLKNEVNSPNYKLNRRSLNDFFRNY